MHLFALILFELLQTSNRTTTTTNLQTARGTTTNCLSSIDFSPKISKASKNVLWNHWQWLYVWDEEIKYYLLLLFFFVSTFLASTTCHLRDPKKTNIQYVLNCQHLCCVFCNALHPIGKTQSRSNSPSFLSSFKYSLSSNGLPTKTVTLSVCVFGLAFGNGDWCKKTFVFFGGEKEKKKMYCITCHSVVL